MYKYFFVFFFLLTACEYIPTVTPKTVPQSRTSTTKLSLSHHPILPGTNESFTLSASIENSSGIKKVQLFVYEYELYSNEDGLPSKRKKSGGLWGEQSSWDINEFQASALFEWTNDAGIGNHSNIEYEFVVTDQNNQLVSKSISFDGGLSPWEEEKILLYKAAGSSLDDAINICFIADADYGNLQEESRWKLFTSHIEDLIYQGYFENNMIDTHRDKWNFFITKRQIDGVELKANYRDIEKYPDFLVEGTIEGIDAFGLIHQYEYGDVSYLQGNLSYINFNLFTSEYYNFGTAVHETGHAVFNFYDEYNGCACTQKQNGTNVFSELADCQKFIVENNIDVDSCTLLKNYKEELWYMAEKDVLFKSNEDCQAYNVANGYPEFACGQYQKVDGSIWYRAENGICIMQDDGDHKVNDFQSVCASLVASFYENLPYRNSMIFAHTDEYDNMYGYVPVLVSECNMLQEHLSIQPKNLKYGIPSRCLNSRKSTFLNLLNQEGRVIESIPLQNSLIVHQHGEDENHIETFNHEIAYLKTKEQKEGSYFHFTNEAVLNTKLEEVILDNQDKIKNALETLRKEWEHRN